MLSESESEKNSLLLYGDCYRLLRKFREGNIFLKVSVCHQSVCPWGDSHMTISYAGLDLTVHGPPTWIRPWLPGNETRGPPAPEPPDRIPHDPPPTLVPAPMLVTFGGHHWRLVQTCSLNLTVQGRILLECFLFVFKF